jgi:hypothetical protein
MPDATDKLTTGSEWVPPRAETWNGLVDLLAEWRRIKKRLAKVLRPAEAPLLPNCIKVKNNTSTQLRLGEIVELETTTLLTNVEQLFPWFNGDVPDETRPFAICAQPIGDGAIGTAYISGRCPALINVGATTDLWAYVNSGEDVLKGDRFWGDVRLLMTPPGTGEQLLWVSFEKSPQSWLGKTDSSHAKGASGTVSVWAGAVGSESDTTFNITSVYNRFANVATTKWVTVTRLHRKPYLTSAEC